MPTTDVTSRLGKWPPECSTSVALHTTDRGVYHQIPLDLVDFIMTERLFSW